MSDDIEATPTEPSIGIGKFDDVRYVIHASPALAEILLPMGFVTIAEADRRARAAPRSSDTTN